MQSAWSFAERCKPARLIPAALLAAFALAAPAQAADPIKIGHVAALSGGSAQSGEAITRGLTIAIDEINAKGGLLGGRKLELVQRDDESTPPKGLTAARELISREKVAIIFGGIDSPVALAMLQTLNKEKVPHMAVWAAGTGITRNGAKPNYIFRVSAVDVLVDVKLLDYAAKKYGAKKAGLILINNPWGESNEKGLAEAVKSMSGMTIVGSEKFENNDVDLVPQLTRLKDKGADVLILVGNAAPGAQVMKARERLSWKVPVVSHWGPAGGRFTELAGPSAQNVHFVQTYSFFGKQSPVGDKVLKALMAKYSDIKGPGDITPAVGVANAYDSLMLVAHAIKLAGTTDGPKIREAMYKIDKHEGLIKTYAKPFSPENHDALAENDYVWTHFVEHEIRPVKN